MGWLDFSWDLPLPPPLPLLLPLPLPSFESDLFRVEAGWVGTFEDLGLVWDSGGVFVGGCLPKVSGFSLEEPVDFF